MLLMFASSGSTGTSGSNAVERIKELEKPLNMAILSCSSAISTVTSKTSWGRLTVYCSSRLLMEFCISHTAEFRIQKSGDLHPLTSEFLDLIAMVTVV